MEQPANDNPPPPPGPDFMAPIIGVIVDDGRVVLSRPLARPSDEGPSGEGG